MIIKVKLRALGVLLSFALLISALSSIVALGAETADLSALSGCSTILPFSSSSFAGFYGCVDNTMVTAEALPSVRVTRLQVSGRILAITCNGTSMAALYPDRVNKGTYSVAVMNTSDGSSLYCSIPKQDAILDNCLAVTEDGVFIVKTDSFYSYVSELDLNGKVRHTYNFNAPAEQVFNNGESVYAKTGDGEIFRLNSGKITKCTQTDQRVRIAQNAGDGYVLTSDGNLISLGGTEVSINAVSAAVTESAVYYADSYGMYTVDGGEYKMRGIKLICAKGGSVAALDNSFRLTALDISEMKNDYEEASTALTRHDKISEPSTSAVSAALPYKIKGSVIYDIPAGTTVAKLREFGDYPVFDANGAVYSSGRLRTGCTAVIKGKKYALSVKGDVTGEGNVNSSDISAIMDFFIGQSTLEGVYLTSVDFNLDGRVGNADLIETARAASGY